MYVHSSSKYLGIPEILPTDSKVLGEEPWRTTQFLPNLAGNIDRTSPFQVFLIIFRYYTAVFKVPMPWVGTLGNQTWAKRMRPHHQGVNTIDYVLPNFRDGEWLTTLLAPYVEFKWQLFPSQYLVDPSLGFPLITPIVSPSTHSIHGLLVMCFFGVSNCMCNNTAPSLLDLNTACCRAMRARGMAYSKHRDGPNIITKTKMKTLNISMWCPYLHDVGQMLRSQGRVALGLWINAPAC